MKKNNITKKAAIFARSSTEGKVLATKIVDCLKFAIKKGFTVSNEYQVAGSGLKFRDTPEIRELLKLIKLHGVNADFGIDAVIIPDRNNLSGIPYERQVFLHVCKENNVEIIPVQGAPILTDVNGSLVENVRMSKKITG